MINEPMDVLQQFPIRKSKKQKQAFRDAVQGWFEGLGYQVATEKGSMGVHNLVIGDPEKAKYLITAHYDTCAHLPFPNFITPCNLLVYLAYQIFIVALFFLVAFVVGFAVFLLTKDEVLTFWGAYMAYWGMLVLMMVGPANKHNANDNTSGVVSVMEIAKSLPESHRNTVCFVLFDLEEAGLLGSAAYRKAHKKATEEQLVLNLDCIGDGTRIVMFPNKKVKKCEETMTALRNICGKFGERSIKLHSKGFAMCPSDHKNFPMGVGIMAFHHKKGIGLYCSRIHTNRDTVLDQTNVNILRAAITTMICQ